MLRVASRVVIMIKRDASPRSFPGQILTIHSVKSSDENENCSAPSAEPKCPSPRVCRSVVFVKESFRDKFPRWVVRIIFERDVPVHNFKNGNVELTEYVHCAPRVWHHYRAFGYDVAFVYVLFRRPASETYEIRLSCVV